MPVFPPSGGGGVTPTDIILERGIPDTVDDAVNIGAFNFTQGSGSLIITITVNTTGFSVSKEYLLPIQFDQTEGVFETALPISSTGEFLNEDFDLDINVDDLVTTLRIRKSKGTIVGTANIVIRQDGQPDDVFTPSTTTSSVTAPTVFFGSTGITQINHFVGINKKLPIVSMDIDGSAKVRDSYEFPDDTTQVHAAIASSLDTIVSTSKFSGDFLDLNAIDTAPVGHFFKPDGKRIFVMGGATDDLIQFDMTGDAWDIENTVNAFEFNVTDAVPAITSPRGIYIRPDGKRLYIVDQGASNAVYQFNFATAWLLSTLVYSGKNFPIPNGTNHLDVILKIDGTRMYVLTTNSPETIHVYGIATNAEPWELDSFESALVDELDIDALGDFPVGFCFRQDGKKLYIAEDENDSVFELNIEDPWLVSTGKVVDQFNVSDEQAVIQDVFMREDMLKMYVLGSTPDGIHELDIGRPSQIGTTTTEAFGFNKLPPIISNVITLPDGKYLIKKQLQGTVELVIDGANVILELEDNLNSPWIFDGTGTFITVKNGSTLSGRFLTVEATSATVAGIIDVENNSRVRLDNLQVAFTDTDETQIKKLGTISGASSVNIEVTNLSGYTSGWSIISASIFTTSQGTLSPNFLATVTTFDFTAITQTAALSAVVIVQGANGTIVNIDNSINSPIILNEVVNATTLGLFYNPAGKNQTAVNVDADNNTGSADSVAVSEARNLVDITTNIVLVDVAEPIEDGSPAANDFIQDVANEEFLVNNFTGVTTYIGLKPRKVKITYETAVNLPSPSLILDIDLRISGVVQSKTIRTMDTSQTLVANYLGGIFVLNPMDTIQSFVTNRTNANNPVFNRSVNVITTM